MSIIIAQVIQLHNYTVLYVELFIYSTVNEYLDDFNIFHYNVTIKIQIFYHRVLITLIPP